MDTIAILHEAMRRINRELNHMKGNAYVFSAKTILDRALAAVPPPDTTPKGDGDHGD
jgi:trans-2-enoyl-CoA reductase